MDILIKKAQEFLNTKGFPFEMKVAQILDRVGFDISQSDYYADPETNKFRELDLIASVGTLLYCNLLDFSFIIECKYSENNPWILFKRKGPLTTPTIGIEGRLSTESARIMQLEMATAKSLFLDSPFFKLPENIGYGVVQVCEKNIDSAYEAFHSVSKAAISHINNTEISYNKSSTNMKIQIVFPVIAIKGMLLSASLDEHNKILLEHIKWGTLIKNGPQFNYNSILVDIVPEESLKEYFEERYNSWDSLVTKIKNSLPKTKQTYQVKIAG